MQDYEITKVITNLKRICQSKETSNVIVWEDLQPTDKSANIITK